MSRKGKVSYLPVFGLTVIFWALLSGMIFFVDPVVLKDFLINGKYLPFFLVFFLAVVLLLTLVFKNLRKGLIYGFGSIVILGLRLVSLGNVVNISLVIGLLIVLDVYFKQIK